MNWSIDLSQNELFIHTEYGPAFLRLRKIDDDVWAFKGGTIALVDGKWIGGFDLAGHRYFMKDGGELRKKSGGRSGFLPYQYQINNGVVTARLWEDKLHRVEKKFGETQLIISGVLYSLSGGRLGTLTPLRSAELDHESDVYARRHRRFLDGLTLTSARV